MSNTMFDGQRAKTDR